MTEEEALGAQPAVALRLPGSASVSRRCGDVLGLSATGANVEL